jgi:lysine 2,3-aminomutase
MSKTLRTVGELAAAGLVTPTPALEAVAARYALAITPALADLIDANDPADPIARQFIPNAAELERDPREDADPIGDQAHSPVEGIVHRHPDRVLLKVTAVCPVYCRFCFRRESVGPDKGGALAPAALETALSYIAGDTRIWEVILTGGDPFILSDKRIAALTARLAAIAHVRIARWHTRLPVAEPERITPALAAALKAEGLATYVVLHANHPRELTAAARAACALLVDGGIPMLSQSVLLKGVNDDAATLEALMRALVETRVKPYYLHQADRAPGTAHLHTGLAEGQALIAALHANASGICQPSYVLDIPGGYGKVPLTPGAAQCRADGLYEIRDDAGRIHLYRECSPSG